MVGFIARRLLALIPLILVISVTNFILLDLLPGDAALAMMGADSYDPARYAQLRAELGLDKPFLQRYAEWMGRVLQGDLGASVRSNMPITNLLKDRMAVTITLTAGGLLYAVVFGIVIGVVAGTRPNTWIDRGLTVLATLGHSIPSFWQGILLIILFAQVLPWLPAFGYRSWAEHGFLTMARYMILPWLTLGSGLMVQIARQMRSAVIEVYYRDFIRTARAKGLSELLIVWRHVLPNSLMPIITIVALQVSELLGGAVVTESVFSLPGIGSAAVSSVIDRDFAVLQAVILLAAVTAVLVSLLADVAYGLLDPRIRYD